MKKSSMLLGALFFGLPAVALADANCTGTIVTACGLQIVKSVCSTTAKTDDDPDEQSELHGQDDGHSDRTQPSEDIHANDGRNTYAQDDNIPPSHFPGQQNNYNFSYTDPRGVVHNVNNSERMGTSPDNKITICHRMGGARVTLDIPDDQIDGIRAHGHGNHPLDTLGHCVDQEDASGNDDPAKIANAVKLSDNSSVTPSVAGCLAAPAGTQVSVTLANGATWTGAAPGCNAPGVFCNVPAGGSASGSPDFSSSPNRGAVRSLR